MESLLNDTLCLDAESIINLTNPILAEQWIFTEADGLLYPFIGPVVATMGVLGNSVCLILPLAVPSLQSNVTALMSNLAVIDIMVLVIMEIWAILDYVSSKIALDYPVNSLASCFTCIASVGIPYNASLGSVTLISVERYLAICMPLRHQMIKGRKRTAKLIATVWLIGLALGLIYVSGFKLQKTCLLWPEEDSFHNLPVIIQLCSSNTVIQKVINVLVFLLCFVTNAVLSCKIVSTMMKRKIRSHCGSQEMISAKIQVTRTLVLNNTIFFLCQLPIRMAYSSQILESIGVDILTKQQYGSAFRIGYACLMLNSCINPYLYVSCCRVYRDAFKQLCCHCLLPCNSHSDQNEIHRRQVAICTMATSRQRSSCSEPTTTLWSNKRKWRESQSRLPSSEVTREILLLTRSGVRFRSAVTVNWASSTPTWIGKIHWQINLTRMIVS